MRPTDRQKDRRKERKKERKKERRKEREKVGGGGEVIEREIKINPKIQRGELEKEVGAYLLLVQSHKLQLRAMRGHAWLGKERPALRRHLTATTHIQNLPIYQLLIKLKTHFVLT